MEPSCSNCTSAALGRIEAAMKLAGACPHAQAASVIPLISRRTFHMIDHHHFHRDLSRFELQTELFFESVQHHPRYVRLLPWRETGRNIPHEIELEIVLALKTGCIPHRSSHRPGKEIRQHLHGGELRDERSLPLHGGPPFAHGMLKLRSALSLKQRVRRDLPRLAMEVQMKPLRQQSLKHLLHLLLARKRRPRFGHNVKALAVEYVRSGDLTILEIVCQLQRDAKRDVRHRDGI